MGLRSRGGEACPLHHVPVGSPSVPETRACASVEAVPRSLSEAGARLVAVPCSFAPLLRIRCRQPHGRATAFRLGQRNHNGSGRLPTSCACPFEAYLLVGTAGDPNCP